MRHEYVVRRTGRTEYFRSRPSHQTSRLALTLSSVTRQLLTLAAILRAWRESCLEQEDSLAAMVRCSSLVLHSSRLFGSLWGRRDCSTSTNAPRLRFTERGMVIEGHTCMLDRLRYNTRGEQPTGGEGSTSSSWLARLEYTSMCLASSGCS